MYKIGSRSDESICSHEGWQVGDGQISLDTSCCC